MDIIKVYKSAGDFIIELIINKADRNNLNRNVHDKNYAKYRIERAFVDKIYHKFNNKKELTEIISDWDANFKYRKGEYVTEITYDPDIDNVCTTGIHFYLTFEAAYYHNFGYPNNYTGEYKSWYSNGRLEVICQYNRGRKNGLYIAYNIDGVMILKSNLKNDLRDGLVEYWYDNGNNKERYSIVDGNREGLYEEWNENGQIKERVFYKNGEIVCS